MNTIKFLREKNMLSTTLSKFIITGSFGTVSLNDLLVEFAKESCVEQRQLCAEEYGARGYSYDDRNDLLLKNTISPEFD